MWNRVHVGVGRRWVLVAVCIIALVLMVFSVLVGRVPNVPWISKFMPLRPIDALRIKPLTGYEGHAAAYNDEENEGHPDNFCFAGELATSISHLPKNLDIWKTGLDSDCMRLLATFECIFDVTVRVGEIVLPEPLVPLVKLWLGNDSRLFREVLKQHVIHVYNKFTKEHTIYNPLRSKRPRDTPDEDPLEYVNMLVEKTKQSCDFCNYENRTAAASFGRIKGKYSVTAANVFSMDGWNGLFLPKTHNPLNISEDELLDTFETAKKWFAKVHEIDRSLIYPSMFWDILPRGGASQVHPHIQGFLDETRYFGGLEMMRLAAEAYTVETEGLYWDDFVAVHHILGLTCTFGGAVAVVPLNARKDHEVILLSSEPSNDLFRLLHYVRKAYQDILKKYCYSTGIAFPAMEGNNDMNMKQSLPAVIRMGTRGDCNSMLNDVSSLDLYLASNVNTDPYVTIAAVREAVKEFGR